MFTQQSLPSPRDTEWPDPSPAATSSSPYVSDEKIAVVAPIPSASVNIAVSVNTGDCRICRKRTQYPATGFAWLASCDSIRSIHPSGSHGRDLQHTLMFVTCVSKTPLPDERERSLPDTKRISNSALDDRIDMKWPCILVPRRQLCRECISETWRSSQQAGS